MKSQLLESIGLGNIDFIYLIDRQYGKTIKIKKTI